MIQINISMPDNCVECPLNSWDGEMYSCPFSGIPALNIGRQANCPLEEVKNRKGHWIVEDVYSNWTDWTFYYCSECGRKFKDLEALQFCPNCGAEMKGNKRR